MSYPRGWGYLIAICDNHKDTYTHTYTYIHTFIIHLAVCLTTGPKPLPKPALHTVRSRASYFKWEYPLLSIRSSNSFLRLLPCLPVTSIPPCIFPSVTSCRRQFLLKCDPSSSPSVYVFHVGYMHTYIHTYIHIMGTGSFPGVKSGRGVTLTPHLLLVPFVMKE
jgi:hypothetical protein